jgi:3',5'-cyclic AMP phosphodiesterase CpdA
VARLRSPLRFRLRANALRVLTGLSADTGPTRADVGRCASLGSAFGAAVPELVDALAACVAGINPHVVAVSGDLTQPARRGQFRRARAFLDALPGFHVVVPGNHDVPLYNVLARFGDPLRGFRGHITADRNPHFCDAEIAVVGANTTRSFTIKDGGLRPADVRLVSEWLAPAPAEAVRIVVCHHPFDPPSGRRGRWTAPVPDANAVNTLVARGADVFLPDTCT